MLSVDDDIAEFTMSDLEDGSVTTCYLVIYATVQVAQEAHLNVKSGAGLATKDGPHHDPQADKFPILEDSKDTEKCTQCTTKLLQLPCCWLAIEEEVSKEEVDQFPKTESTEDKEVYSDLVVVIETLEKESSPHDNADCDGNAARKDSRCGLYSLNICHTKVPKTECLVVVHRCGSEKNLITQCTHGIVRVNKEDSKVHQICSEEVVK